VRRQVEANLECRVHRPEKYYEPSPMGPLERTRMILTSATTLIRVAYPFQPQPAFVAFRPAPQPCSQVSQPAVRDSSTKDLGRRRCCRPPRAGRRDRAAANSRFYHGHADGDPKAAPSLAQPKRSCGHLPAKREAAAIRAALEIRKRRRLSADGLAQLQAARMAAGEGPQRAGLAQTGAV